jgi:hypothetical protein
MSFLSDHPKAVIDGDFVNYTKSVGDGATLEPHRSLTLSI